MLKNHTRDIFSGGIEIDGYVRLVAISQMRNDRIVLAEDHLVIQLRVNPGLDSGLDLLKIDDHPARVESFTLQLYFYTPIVTVKILTLSLVVQQAVPVTEVDDLGDRVSMGHLGFQCPVLSAQWSVPSAQFSVPSSQCPVLSAQCSVLSAQF